MYLSITLGLLLGGALGNLIDRLRLGYVVDFVDVGHRRPALVHVQRGRRGDQLRSILLLIAAAHHRPSLAGAGERSVGWLIHRTRAGDARPAHADPDRAARRRGSTASSPTLTGLSRSYVQKLISDGRLTVDGRADQGEHDRRPRHGRCELDVPPPVAARPRRPRRRSRSTSSTRTTTC